MKLRPLLTPALVLLAAAAASGADILKIRTDRPGAEIQPTMYGLFFEDINYAADGGLYAEMVKNRSFEFPQNLMGWESFGKVSVRDDDGPFDRNPHYVRLLPSGHPHKSTGLTNEGFFGVAYRKGEEYRFSVWARTIGDKSSRIRVELTDPASMGETQVTASARLTIGSTDWQRYTLTLTPSETVRKGQLRIFLDSDAGCDLEHVSLFPADTWMGHENGLRKDLAQKLADIRPGVFRFPGGCIVEGTDLATRYQWKSSVGP
ncbi:MAG: carbohydrate binding domain-containing protein, partial [Duncaniella sp.]|nr:carbohydrate binding domain-containing protein [Duncaniella sp.]